MKSNRVAPYFGEVKAKEIQPIEKMRNRLTRHTKCQTMIISSTTIFNMEALEPLQQIMVQVRILIDSTEVFEFLNMFFAITGGAIGRKLGRMSKDHLFLIVHGKSW